MSKIDFFATSQLKIKNISSKREITRLRRTDLKEASSDARSVRVDAIDLIPIDVLNKIGKEIVSADKSYYGDIVKVNSNHFNEPELLSKALNANIFKVRDTYYAFYVALIRAARAFTKRPNIPFNKPPTSKSFNIRANNVSGTTYLDIPSTNVNVSLNWEKLSAYTIAKKKELGERSFWHHTGEGSDDFMRITDKILRFKASSLVTSQFLVKGSKSRGTAELSYRYKITNPSVDPLVDAMLTIPLMTGVATDPIFISKFDVKTTSGGSEWIAKGINRLGLAEHNRPILRPLATGTREVMLASLKDQLHSRSDNPIREAISLENETKKTLNKLVNDYKAEQNKIKKAEEALAKKAATAKRNAERAENKAKKILKDIEDRKQKALEDVLRKEAETIAAEKQKLAVKQLKEELSKADKATKNVKRVVKPKGDAAKTAPKTAAKTSPKTAAKTAPKTAAKTTPKTAAKPAPKTAAKPAPKTAAKTSPNDMSIAQHVNYVDKLTKQTPRLQRKLNNAINANNTDEEAKLTVHINQIKSDIIDSHKIVNDLIMKSQKSKG